MNTDLEQQLARELAEVADRVHVPALPTLPAEPPHRSRWGTAAPLLVAAVAVIAAAATVVALLTFRGADDVDPAPAPATPSATDEPVSTAAPRLPVVVGEALFVDGQQVPGRWYWVDGTADGWVAGQADGTWYTGTGADPLQLGGQFDQPPAVSPDGSIWAAVDSASGEPTLTGGQTLPDGAAFGLLPVPASDPSPRVSAVTDDGLVVVRGADYQYLWRPLDGGDFVDLADTAPGTVVLGNTPAGLLVVDGDLTADGTGGRPYLAQISRDGSVTPRDDVPPHDVLTAGARWIAYVTPGTIGGEASTTGELQVQQLGGPAAGVLTPPEGYQFEASTIRWESTDELLAVVSAEDGTQRVARCRADPASCVLVELG